MIARLSIALLLAAMQAGAAVAQGLPLREASCTRTRIARLEHRLQSGATGAFLPNSGSAVVYEGGGYQVGYEELPQIGRSRAGDEVELCLVHIPRDCPAGDARGRVYTATNLRTQESWTLPDASHGCGGA